jgi:hypothetical protein
MKKLILVFGLLLSASTLAESQPLILYKTDDPHGKYLLSRSVKEADKSTVSEVIIAETFDVRTDRLVCQIVMSNAFVYQTRMIGGSSVNVTNQFVQNKSFVGELVIGVFKGTEIVFHNSVVPVSQLRVESFPTPTSRDLPSVKKKLLTH